MIKFIKELSKLIEGILFLYLPIVLFYWLISLINLDIIKPIVLIFGSVVDPLMAPFKHMLQYSVKYDEYTVDFSVLLFAVIIFITTIILNKFGEILNFIEKIVNKIKNKIRTHEKINAEISEKISFIEKIKENNTVYVVLKLIKNNPNETYLITDGTDDFFSVGLVDSYESSIKNIYKKFGGKLYNDSSNQSGMNKYIFTDVNKFLEYLKYAKERVLEVNKGMLDLNINYEYKIACHCSISDASADIDFDITTKILNLCDNKEILISEIIKNRLEVLEKFDYKVYSRGVYLIQDKQMDVFMLKID